MGDLGIGGLGISIGSHHCHHHHQHCYHHHHSHHHHHCHGQTYFITFTKENHQANWTYMLPLEDSIRNAFYQLFSILEQAIKLCWLTQGPHHHHHLDHSITPRSSPMVIQHHHHHNHHHDYHHHHHNHMYEFEILYTRVGHFEAVHTDSDLDGCSWIFPMKRILLLQLRIWQTYGKSESKKRMGKNPNGQL